MATIRDVAERADVHPSTVSRVFSGSASISEATKKRVVAAAEELDFWPNAIARSLSIQKTNTLGIVIPYVFEGFFDDIFFPQIMRGMLNAAYDHGYRLIVGGSDGYQNEIEQIKEIMGSNQADGIVVMSSRLDVDTVGALIKQGTPFVLLGHPPSREYEEIFWVDVNNYSATQQAVDYLISLGHRRIAYVGGDPEVITTQERERAYRRCLQETGIEINPGWIDYGYFAEEGGSVAVERMMALEGEMPTAYYAANDLMAFGVIRALKGFGFSVPEDVSVIGTNDSPAALQISPALTTIQVPYAEMAGEAVELLIGQINGERKKPANRVLDCSLVVRGTTAPLG